MRGTHSLIQFSSRHGKSINSYTSPYVLICGASISAVQLQRITVCSEGASAETLRVRILTVACRATRSSTRRAACSLTTEADVADALQLCLRACIEQLLLANYRVQLSEEFLGARADLALVIVE